MPADLLAEHRLCAPTLLTRCPLRGRPPCPTVSSSVVPASTTSRTSRSSCRATPSSSSPGCPARASPAWRSTRSSPRASAATSSRCPPTPGSSSARWTSPTSTSSRGSARRSRSTRSRPRATPGRRWARSPRSTTTSGCSMPAPGVRTARCAAGRSAGRRPQADRRPGPGARRGHQVPGAGSGHPGTQGRVRRAVPRPADQGLQPGARSTGWSTPSPSRRRLKKQEKHTIEVVVDRLQVKQSAKRRLTDSVETALGLGGGLVTLDFVDLPDDDPHRERQFSEHLVLPLRRPVVRGARAAVVLVQLARSAPARRAPASAPGMEVDPELVVPDPALSLADGALAPWTSASTTRLLRSAASRH